MAFDPNIRLIAAARTGGICANPRCSCYLLGPGDDGPNHVDVFEAAHIISAAPGGPRYQYLVDFDYDHITNCIPLCRSCHRLVDHRQNSRMYPVEVLRDWRDQAEEMARQRRNKPVNAPFFDPDKERKIKDKFADHLAEIVNPLWQAKQFVPQGILPHSVYIKICHGANGFSAGKWTFNHPDRSHDARIANAQDTLVETMERLRSILWERDWAKYTWLPHDELCSFRSMPFTSIFDREDENHYKQRLGDELNTLNRQAHDFLYMPY
ncbi:hypothetical protein DBR45_23635 [Pseudomonas sp. HMWF031]|nr:hypothetical protein DBR45_23635 [Pseudomonas sp. HMWF031]